LVSRNFPIVGFTKAEDLKNQFEIKLVEKERAEPSRLIWLHLKVKADSIYKNDYTSVDLWVDKKSYLPAAIRAISTEEDFYAIKLLDAKVNEKIGKEVFEIKIPKGFGEEVVPLKKKD
jgi:outer membrane lipoprotein-sorting protein